MSTEQQYKTKLGITYRNQLKLNVMPLRKAYGRNRLDEAWLQRYNTEEMKLDLIEELKATPSLAHAAKRKGEIFTKTQDNPDPIAAVANTYIYNWLRQFPI